MLIVELMNELLYLGLIILELLIIHVEHFLLLLPLIWGIGADLVNKILLVKLQRAFAANGLELPPVILVKLLDRLHIIRPLYKIAIWILLCSKDGIDEVNPWS